MAQKNSALCRFLSCLTTTTIVAVILWYVITRPEIKSLDDLRDAAGDFKDDVTDVAGDLKDKFTNVDWGDFSDVLKNLTGNRGDLWDRDPFMGDNTKHAWRTNNGKKKGLDLELQNALDETWQNEFYLAVKDWDEGTPDALTLSTKKVAVNYNTCSPVNGVMKVCNANYGATGWLGVNEVITTVPAGIITQSVAKMNEYYLLNAGPDDRQYTMCHEIGHGFGLAHTDEDFMNADLGNCMDYTNRPENNLHPDESNYLLLQSMYGTVGGRRLRSGSEIATDSAKSDIRQSPILTAELRKEYNAAIKELEQARANPKGDQFNWRHLREHSRGAHFARKLGREHVLEVHMLYAMPK